MPRSLQVAGRAGVWLLAPPLSGRRCTDVGTGESSGRLGARPSPDDRPRIRRPTQGARCRRTQAASATATWCGPRRGAVGNGCTHEPSLPGSPSASAKAAACLLYTSDAADEEDSVDL